MYISAAACLPKGSREMARGLSGPRDKQLVLFHETFMRKNNKKARQQGEYILSIRNSDTPVTLSCE